MKHLKIILILHLISVLYTISALGVLEHTVTLQQGLSIRGQTYLGNEDTFLYPWDPDSTYGNGSKESLAVTDDYGGIKAFLRFDISMLPQDAKIVEAILSLYCTGGSGYYTMKIYRCTQLNWIEDKATWNKYDGVNAWITPGGDYDITVVDTQSAQLSSWTNFDVTTTIQSYVDSYEHRSCFVIKGGGYSWVNFYSSECSSINLRPKLVITYTSNAPIADAGSDQTVGKNTIVILDATSSSDPNESQKSLKYHWHFLSIPKESILTDNSIQPNNTSGNNGADRPQFTVDALGNYIIELTVTNSQNLFSKDIVKITSFYIKNEHPRIWLTPELLTTLKQKMQTNTIDWQRFKNYLPQDTSIQGNALAYQLIGDKTYADKVISKLQTYLTYETNPRYMEMGQPQIGPYNVRYILPEIAIGYDWVYECLDTDLKNNIINKINEWVDMLNTAYGNSGSNNYCYGYLVAEGLVGIATYGDNPRAREFIEHNRIDRYENKIIPFLNTYGVGGCWLEGGYEPGIKDFLFDYMAAVKTATGENLFRSTRFPEESIYSMIYITMPNPAYIQPWDTWSNFYGPNSGYHRYFMLTLAYEFAGTPAGEYAQWWLNHCVGQRFDFCYWQEFLWYNPNAPEKDISSLPTDWYASGTGWLFSRSGWTNNSTVFSFRNVPYIAEHQHWDSNHFMIYKNEWLAVDSQMYSSNELVMKSYGHNTFIINDQDQYPGIGSAPGSTFSELGENYVYVKGDATRAYSEKASGGATRTKLLNNFVRQIIYLKPDYFIIFDRISSTDPGYSKKWLLHTKMEPVITENQIIAVNGNGKLFTKTLLPSNCSITKVNEKTLRSDLNSWRIVVQPTDARTDDLFLNILYTADASTNNMPAITKIDGSNIVGVQIANSIVMFSKEEKQLDSGQFNVTGSGIYKTIIADLIPNRNYDILIDNNWSGTYSTSNNGIMVFDLPINNNHSIIISSVPIDNIKPAAITNLEAITGTQPGSVTLKWTAVGDDANDGTATSYLIKYSPLPINLENWNSANNIDNELSPKLSGSNEIFTVTGLIPGQNYYFAIRVLDEIGNISDLSNIPSATAGKEILGRTGKPNHIDTTSYGQ